MPRTITRSLPLLAVLFSFLLSSCSDSLVAKRHYGNRMYVKVDKQKKESIKHVDATAENRSAETIAALPQQKSKRLGGDIMPTPLRAIEKGVKTIATARESKRTSQAAAVHNEAQHVQMVKTINITRADDVNQDVDGGDITNVLVIIGLILIIVGVVALILEVAPAGWLGLLRAGLLIILLAYLLF